MQSESLRQANGMFWKRQWEEKELVWLGGLEVPPPTLGCEYFSATSVAASFLQPHCCRGTYVLSGNIWKAFPLWMYEVHIKKPDKDVNFRLRQPGGSSQAVCRPATMLPPPRLLSIASTVVETKHTQGRWWQQLAAAQCSPLKPDGA